VDVPAGAGAEVCLGCRRDVSSGLVEVKKNAHNVCVIGWPKALEVIWTTTVFPALDWGLIRLMAMRERHCSGKRTHRW
jgi:hypothetical protein